MPTVRIPIITTTTGQVASSGANLYNRNSSFGQSACQQHALPTNMVTVHCANAGIFPLQVIGFLNGRAEQHVGSHLAKPIHPFVVGLVPNSTFQLLPQSPALNHSIFLQRKLQVQLATRITRYTTKGLTGRSSHENRIIVGTQPATIFPCH